ncbi:MAG: DUF6252 family protein, partial [Flavobacteriales bacterium]
TLILQVDGTEEKEYQIDISNQQDSTLAYYSKGSKDYFASKGTISITNYKKGEKVSGEFNFTLNRQGGNETLKVTDGKIKKVKPD